MKTELLSLKPSSLSNPFVAPHGSPAPYPVGSDTGFQGQHSLYPPLHMLPSSLFFCIFFMNSVSKVKCFRLIPWKAFSIRVFNLTSSNCQCHHFFLWASVFTMILGVGKAEQLEDSSIYGTAQVKVPTGFQLVCSTIFFFNFEYEECVPHYDICLVAKIKQEYRCCSYNQYLNNYTVMFMSQPLVPTLKINPRISKS